MKGLVEKAGLIFITNIFNLSLEKKNSWLGRMDEDITAKISAPWPAHCIPWRLATDDWIPAYCKKAGINSIGSRVGIFSRVMYLQLGYKNFMGHGEAR